MKNIWFIIFFILAAIPNLLAQDLPIEIGDTITVTINDDKELYGVLTGIYDEFLVLENDGKKINIPLKLIVFYTEKSGMTGTINPDYALDLCYEG